MSSSKVEGCSNNLSPPASIAESSEGLDFISQLPDCILTSIMFFLPLKESVRAGILSSRWRDIWKLTPLCLDDSPSASSQRCPWDDTFALDPSASSLNTNYNPLDRPYSSRFARILSAHDGPVHSLRLSGVKGFVFRQTVTHLVNTVVKRGIRELALDFDFNEIDDYHYRLPLSLFGSGSLQILTLRQCLFPVPAPHSVFPNLKELNLMRCMELNIDLLETVLASCGSLETVQLVSCRASRGIGCGCFSVSSTSLRKFVINDAWILSIKELIINASNLEYLMLCPKTATDCDVKVRHTTSKLQVLGFISAEFNKLQIGHDYFVQQQSTKSAPTIDLREMPSGGTLSTVKTLAIDIELGSIDNCCSNVAVILGSFSCIENLYINYDYYYNSENPGFWNKQGSFTFMETHLKCVIINGFIDGTETVELSKMEFMRFLVLNGKVLDKIIILRLRNIHPDREMIKKRICFDKRASEDLELIVSTQNECREHVSMWKPLDNEGFVEFP